MVVLGGLMSTAWNTLFNVVPPERRGQVLAFNNGVPAQIGVVLSGLMILLSKRILDTQAILLLGGFVALANIFLALRMKPAYGEALLRALRAGRAEVFSEQEEAFSGYRNDPAALQVLRTELRNPKTHMRRLAAEMLARVGNLSAVPDLVQRLSDPEPEVRAAATRALVELDADSATSEILLGLDDPAEIVREQTLASLPRLKPAPSPELIRLLEHLLDDPNLQIAAYAAGMLLLLHREECARPFLGSLLRDENVTRRHIALDALGRIAGVGDAQTAFNLELVLNALNDPSALIRRDAIKVAALFEVEAAYAAIFKCLSDSDATVRRLASEAMKQAWSWSYESVFQILEERNDPALEAALEAIPPGDPLNFYPLRGYIQREASKIRRMRRLIEALPEEGRALALLLETLKRHELASEERLIKAVGLFRNPRALDLIRKSLNAGDAATRAAALEALETLGEREVTREILPLLDGAGILASAADQKMGLPEAVSVLLGDQDDWLRALMAWSVPELDLKEFVPALHTLSSDPALLVRQAAMDALARMEDGDKMKTLKTISALERILLLREVPMFSGLCPEDLEQIAQVAEEQIYPDQAVICYEGEPGNTLFIISSGRIQVVKTSDQKEHILAVRTAGQFVGEMAILESAPRSATLKANGDVRVLAIDGNAFTSILLDRPEVAVSVLRHMSSRVRELNEKVGAAG
jgi:HEAT repeat protein